MSYEVLFFSIQIRACSHPLPLQQNTPKFAQNWVNLPNYAKICPKTNSLRNFKIPPKIEILMFFKKITFVLRSIKAYAYYLDF
jgi:hypothetical protein